MEEAVRILYTFIAFIKKRWKFTVVVVFLLISMIYVILFQNSHHEKIYLPKLATQTIPTTTEQSDNTSYLVWSENCQIPNINPHEKQIMKLYKKIPYQSCTAQGITIIRSDEEGNGILTFNDTVIDKLLSEGSDVTCCYSIIRNHNETKYFDIKILISDCIIFDAPVKLSPGEEFITTKCEVQDKSHKKKVYKNAHTNIQMTKEIEKRLATLNINNTERPWNVLVLGIDTMSRINLARAMPKTNAFLKNNNWLDFQGYNKIDENTYPNLIAILTGRNQTHAKKVCDSQGVNSPDNCDFMWKRYQEVGYVTAYGEDWVGIDTFGRPYHTGFSHRPTDHYLRPLYKSSENRIENPHISKHFCTGQTTSAELLFDYSIEFIKKYKDQPYFGFFWSNTFSHDDLSSPSSMDERIEKVLRDLTLSGALNTTIVFFISDHGLRFGRSRYLLTGYYEERLPAFFAWLPPKFKETYPILYKNMLANTERLTNPYDVYMTLEDILKISGKIKYPAISDGCSGCKSLFEPMPFNRSCEDSSITHHWCTCNPLKIIPTDHKIGNRAVNYVINVEIEKTLSTVNSGTCRVCAKLKLDKILHLYTYEYLKGNSNNSKDYLVVFSTTPGDMAFEATVRYYKSKDQFQVFGIVSRLTFYQGTGYCVESNYLKNYCYCTTCYTIDTKGVGIYLLGVFIFVSVVFALNYMSIEGKKSNYKPIRA